MGGCDSKEAEEVIDVEDDEFFRKVCSLIPPSCVLSVGVSVSVGDGVV